MASAEIETVFKLFELFNCFSTNSQETSHASYNLTLNFTHPEPLWFTFALWCEKQCSLHSIKVSSIPSSGRQNGA